MRKLENLVCKALSSEGKKQIKFYTYHYLFPSVISEFHTRLHKTVEPTATTKRLPAYNEMALEILKPIRNADTRNIGRCSYAHQVPLVAMTLSEVALVCRQPSKQAETAAVCNLLI